VDQNIAFLELKYGNIYGGYPNFYAISEVAFLLFEPRTQRVYLESWKNDVDIDVVNVYSKVNELGNTIGKIKEVVNLRTGRKTPFDEEHKLGEEDLDVSFDALRPTRAPMRFFLTKAFRKYRFQNIVTFDGNRDVFLCQKARVNFDYYNIIDLQKDITKETNYLFSLNKLAKVIDFKADYGFLKSNNIEYRLHPIASRQITPKSAAFDAARLLMIHNEYRLHKDDFLMKAALLLNKIESSRKPAE